MDGMPWSSGFWEETHVPKVAYLNPGAVYWMDLTFLHIDLM